MVRTRVPIVVRPAMPVLLPYGEIHRRRARVQEQASNEGLQGARRVLPGIDRGPRSDPRAELHKEGANA